MQEAYRRVWVTSFIQVDSAQTTFYRLVQFNVATRCFVQWNLCFCSTQNLAPFTYKFIYSFMEEGNCFKICLYQFKLFQFISENFQIMAKYLIISLFSFPIECCAKKFFFCCLTNNMGGCLGLAYGALLYYIVECAQIAVL